MNQSALPCSPSWPARFLTRGRSLLSRWRILLARISGAKIGPGCFLGRGCDLDVGCETSRRGGLQLGAGCILENNVVLRPYGGHITLGHDVFLGPCTVIYGHGGVEIGADTLISMQCRILSSNHAIPPADTAIRSQPDLLLPTKIGRDVWLGAGVTVLGGVTIGDGCIVGAGAVVTHDLPPCSVSAGVPAKVIRQRVQT